MGTHSSLSTGVKDYMYSIYNHNIEYTVIIVAKYVDSSTLTYVLVAGRRPISGSTYVLIQPRVFNARTTASQRTGITGMSYCLIINCSNNSRIIINIINNNNLSYTIILRK